MLRTAALSVNTTVLEEKDQIQHLYLRFISGRSTPAELELLFYHFRVCDSQELRGLIATGLELREELAVDRETERASLERVHDEVYKRVHKMRERQQRTSSPLFLAIFIISVLALLIVYLYILLK